jgi:hypothetical protein
VFSFGTWDVWTLSALPREVGETVLDKMVTTMFYYVELLYKEALSENSVASSDFWDYADDALLAKAQGGGSHAFENTRQETEAFRVLIPQVFDISITPGWHDLRPAPPAPHASSVQMINAAHLAQRWNSNVQSQIEGWKRRPDPVSENDKGEHRSMQDDANPKADRGGTTNKAKRDKEIFAPYPRRLAHLFDAPAFILDAIIEKQMRTSQLADSNGVGARPTNDSVHFADVWRPCRRSGVARATSRAQVRRVGHEERSSEETCANPGDHLFYTPFTVGQRAIEQIAFRASLVAEEELVLREEVESRAEGSRKEKRRVGENGAFQQVVVDGKRRRYWGRADRWIGIMQSGERFCAGLDSC